MAAGVGTAAAGRAAGAGRAACPCGPRSASSCAGKGTVLSTSPQSCRLKASSAGGQSRASARRAQAAAGSPRPSLLAGTSSSCSNIGFAVCAALFRGTSPLNTSERSSAIGRWLSSRPLAPPASKAAAILRNIGSLCSSASIDCWMMFASFLSSVFTPQMRRLLVAPFSPSLPSSSSMSAELSPPSTRYVSVCTQSTRQA
mmetsp:Transcript_53944/g.157433  ORF Transcript_53944/g.157433 Transcript_53944/m.157433 type:complete len:200 (-) Transcript_53944:349-948(-)